MAHRIDVAETAQSAASAPSTAAARLLMTLQVTVTVLALGVGGCAALELRPIDFELTGRVLDRDTRQPIEGAYVIAVYQEMAGDFIIGIKTWCVKTRGMYTDVDGQYHFPVERLDGASPDITAYAIKPGYVHVGWSKAPTAEEMRHQNAEVYSRRDIYLAPQNPTQPNWKLDLRESGDYCWRAKVREDAAASAQFLRIELAEFRRLGREEWAQEIIAKRVADLESLPPKVSP